MGRTIADQLIQQGHVQGRQAGRQEGRQEGILEGQANALRNCIRMLLAGRPAGTAAAADLDHVDAATLERWLPRLIAGESLDRIVAGDR